MADTTTAPALSVLAELVLLASREGLPMPTYLSMSSTNAQLGLSLSTRAELDAWNAQVGGTRVFECEPKAGALDVLLTTLHGGLLLGWSVDLNVRVPLPLSVETLDGLAAVEAGAKQIVASLDVTVADKQLLVKPGEHAEKMLVYRGEHSSWIGVCVCGFETRYFADRGTALVHLSSHIVKATESVEVQPDAEAVDRG